MKHVALVVALAACHRPRAATDDAAAGAATVAAIPAATTAGASARTYAIHMRRPGHVGDTARVSVDDEHDERTSARVAGATKDSEKSSRAHIEGTIRLLALQPDGQSPLGDEMTVGEFWTAREDGTKTTLAPTGARLEVVRGATKRDPRVTIDGRAAPKEVVDALDHLTILTLHKGPSDDDVFGTSVPQPVGAEWPVNASLAEQDLRARGLGVPPGSVSGATKLVAVRTIHGIDCLELDHHMTVSGLQSTGELPPGSTIQSGSIEVHMHMLLPIDETKAALRTEMDLTIKGTVTLPSPKGPAEVELESMDHKQAAVVP